MRFFLGSRFNEGILLINMDYLDYPNQWDKLEVKVIEIYSGDENHVSKQNSSRWAGATFCGVTSGAILFAYVP